MYYSMTLLLSDVTRVAAELRELRPSLTQWLSHSISMDDKPGGSVADRFVSSKALEEAKAKREAEWQDAYSRLGQEVPQELREQIERGREGDGRSLFDQLRENRTKKQEAFEEKTKLKNQFRPLDDEEIGFLDRIVDDTNEQEEERKKEESEQLKQFRECALSLSIPD